MVGMRVSPLQHLFCNKAKLEMQVQNTIYSETSQYCPFIISLEFIISLRLLSRNSVPLIASRTGRIYANANTHITILLSGLCELLFENLQPTWLACAAVKSKPGLIVFAEQSLFCDSKCFDGGILHGRPPITNRLSFIPLMLNYTLWVGSTHTNRGINSIAMKTMAQHKLYWQSSS